jgi:hypothetical protein
MRTARAAPVGRPTTKAARAPPQNEESPAEPLLGNRKARAPTEPAARPPSLGSASPAVAAPAGSGDPAQLPWASRSRASRCPSGGRSEICVPCGWQHSPSSEACSCQVRPSQHQPWLVSTCSVTAHPSHRFCYPSASTQRRATHTSPAARTGPRPTTTTAGLAPWVVGRDFLQLTRGWSSAEDGVLPRHRRSSTGCYRAGGRPWSLVAALGGTSSTQTLASLAGTTMAFRSGRRG